MVSNSNGEISIIAWGGWIGATVGVTSSSSSDVDRKTLEEASCDVVNESSDKGNS